MWAAQNTGELQPPIQLKDRGGKKELDIAFAQQKSPAVTRIRTGVAAATTQSTNHYTITAHHWLSPVGDSYLSTKGQCLVCPMNT